MKQLYIVGSGDIGKFIAYNFELFKLEEFELKGFLDTDTNRIGESFCGLNVFEMNYISDIKENIGIVIGIANPRIKEKVYNELNNLNVCFPNCISCNSWISNNVKIGKGVIIYPNSSIEHESEVGDFVTINVNSSIGHNSILENFSTIAPGVNLAGFTHIGKKVDMGIGSSTRQKVVIGESTVVGGNSMIIKNLDANKVYVGIPAKELKK